VIKAKVDVTMSNFKIFVYQTFVHQSEEEICGLGEKSFNEGLIHSELLLSYKISNILILNIQWI
jgi:hypothetical protein